SPNPPLWQPLSRPQGTFLTATDDEILYGGAKGGAKTESLVIRPLQQVYHPEYKALILREVHSELQEILDRSAKYYKPLGAEWQADPKRWRFPSGAYVRVGYYEHDRDIGRYQGYEP